MDKGSGSRINWTLRTWLLSCADVSFVLFSRVPFLTILPSSWMEIVDMVKREILWNLLDIGFDFWF